MLFENPNAAAKLFPTPFNIPPPVRISGGGGLGSGEGLLLEHHQVHHPAGAHLQEPPQHPLVAVLHHQQQQQQQQQQQHLMPVPMAASPAVAAAAAAAAAAATAHAQAQAQAQQANGGSHSGSSGRSTPIGGVATNGNQVATPAASQPGQVSGTTTPASVPAATDPAPGKLFVGGLSWQTSSEKLREYFGMFGSVTDVLIMKDPVTQRSRGFGFITFSEPHSVDNVLKVPIHTLDGKKIDPKHATPKNRPKQANKTKKIFVGGVSQDTSSEEVKAYFNQFGKVEETVMLMDQQTKRHRGFGFVTFENEDVVDRVCEIHFHTIKNKKVECKKAQPKEAVQATATLLGKRLATVGTAVLGGRLPAPPPAPLAVAQAQAQVHAAAAAAAAYPKLIYPAAAALAAYRYAPYPNPSAAAAPAPAPSNPAPTSYHPYQLAGVDMSSFQGIDWASMYGMGMYV